MSLIRKDIPLFDTVSSIITIISNEVVQAGTASSIHIVAANTKMAMIRCCNTVSPYMPKASLGKNHITVVRIATNSNLAIRAFFSKSLFAFISRLLFGSIYCLCKISNRILELFLTDCYKKQTFLQCNEILHEFNPICWNNQRK